MVILPVRLRKSLPSQHCFSRIGVVAAAKSACWLLEKVQCGRCLRWWTCVCGLVCGSGRRNLFGRRSGKGLRFLDADFRRRLQRWMGMGGAEMGGMRRRRVDDRLLWGRLLSSRVLNFASSVAVAVVVVVVAAAAVGSEVVPAVAGAAV